MSDRPPKNETVPDSLVRILLIDDEPTMAESLQERLQSSGFTVDVSATLQDAKRLLQHNAYQIVISDLIFTDEQIGGDEFLLQNEALMPDARKVIITGQGIDRIRHLGELQKKGVAILEKGQQTFLPRLREISNDAAREREANALSATVSRSSSTKFSAGPRVVEKARDLLLDWLKGCTDSDKSGILYDGHEFSPNMLIQEIEHGTEIGNAHLDMFLEFIKHRLEL